MKRALVFGSTGFLGRSFGSASLERIIPVTRQGCDFTKPLTSGLKDFLRSTKASYAIILTSISSPDDCLRDPVTSEAVNVTGAQALLQELRSLNIKPVFFSSDHVFDGIKGNYLDDAPYSPITLYGKQKMRMECFVRENFTDFLVMRTSKQVSMRIDKMNTLWDSAQKLLTGQKIRCAHDSWLAPTFTEDIVRLTFAALDQGLSGIYNMAPEKHYSRLELGYEIADQMGANRNLVESCSIKDFKFLEVRPTHCTLNGRKLLTELKTELTSLPAGLKRCKPTFLASAKAKPQASVLL